MAIAWVFPGQGSQKVGMADPVLSLSGASQRFAMASELLGRDLLAICQGNSGGGSGPDDLNDTRNTQPALFVVESLLVDNLIEQGRDAALVAQRRVGPAARGGSRAAHHLNEATNSRTSRWTCSAMPSASTTDESFRRRRGGPNGRHSVPQLE